MTPHALKFVRFDRIEDHYRIGWVMSFPNAPMHHHRYGVELAWICDCPIPGLKYSTSHRVSQTTHTGDASDRAEHRT